MLGRLVPSSPTRAPRGSERILYPQEILATSRGALRGYQGAAPLGRVYHWSGVAAPCRRFLDVTPNSEMVGVFWMHESRRLYGRQTEMTLAGAKRGDIVEVLAPI